MIVHSCRLSFCLLCFCFARVSSVWRHLLPLLAPFFLPCSHDTDQADLSQHFDTACDFISAALGSGHRVLVHCQQGISRSSTLTIAYLIRSRSLTVSDAYMLVRTARLVAKPKGNFIRQLVKYEQRLKKEATAVAAATPAPAASSAPAVAASVAPSAAPVLVTPPPAAAAAPSSSPPNAYDHLTLVVNVAPGSVMLREGDPQSHNPIDEEIERQRTSKEAAAATAAATATATAAAAAGSTDKQQQASNRKQQRRENGDDAALPTATDAAAAASTATAAASSSPLDSPPAATTAHEVENQQKRRRIIICGAESAAIAPNVQDAAAAVSAAASASSSSSSAAASSCTSPPSSTQLALETLSPSQPSLHPHVHQSCHTPDTSESSRRTVGAMLETDKQQQQERKEQEQ